jgi:hypothetical protein
MAVYSQSVRLGAKPLEVHDQRLFFAAEPLLSEFLFNILSDERMGLSRMNMIHIFKCTYRTYSILLKILPFALYANPLSV